MNFTKNRFLKANFRQIGEINYSDKENETGEIVAHGPWGDQTKVIVQNKRGFGFKLSETFVKTYKDALGPEAESVIAKEKEEIRETQKSLREAERQLKESEKFLPKHK